nr:MAG TPA: hypothetical protein [Caudoviricetes sp.]
MEKDYFKISRNELRRLLILEMYFDAIIKLSPIGDFYGELYKNTTGEELGEELSQDERREKANMAVEEKSSEIIRTKFESLE